MYKNLQILIIKTIKNYFSNSKDSILLLISSILLGVWAAKGTIALRNILIISGAIVALFYIFKEIRNTKFRSEIKILSVTPISLILLAFIWVVFHYHFFSIDHEQQSKELMSTWLRSFLSTILGFGTGMVLRNHPLKLNFLWIGILVAFLVLFKQYIPIAIAEKKLLNTEYDNYLFHLKINVVMMGAILLTGVNSGLWDSEKQIQQLKSKIIAPVYFVLINLIVLWAFVFIVDTRNGIAIFIILYLFWFFYALLVRKKNKFQSDRKNHNFVNFLLGIGLALGVIFLFFQTSINRGWSSTFEDFMISIQIDKYQHWKNISKFGVPQNTNGKFVVSNTYERISLATVGARQIIRSPVGVGVLKSPLLLHSSSLGLDGNLINFATHSGWIELGLAFGIPILGIAIGWTIIIFFCCYQYQYKAKITILSITILIVFFYLIGEAAIQHGLEILFFLLALVSGLAITNSK